jgi:Aminoglycoside-2''-adenylyltransferase
MTAEAFEPDLGRWDAWHPSEVAQRLSAVAAPWCVTAGWAIDLFLGRQTRAHEDIEIAVPEHAFSEIRDALAEFEFFAIGDGLAHPIDEHTLARHYQTWVREPDTGAWRLDVMREPWEGDTWVFRRDPRVSRASSRVIARAPDGIPYAAPEVALLYKAKALREKDQADFEHVLPRLEREQRAWLADALALVHAGHVWLEPLRRG